MKIPRFPTFKHPEIKSVGRGITLVSDITENDEIYRVILSLSHEVSRELRKHRLSAGGVQISVKSNELKSVQFQKRRISSRKTQERYQTLPFRCLMRDMTGNYLSEP